MNHLQAINAARKILGPKAVIERNDRAPADDAERAAQRGAFATARAAMKSAEQAMQDRASELMRNDPEYQRLRAARKAAGDVVRSLPSGNAHRVTIGTHSSIGGFGVFCVDAHGDNYADAIAKLKAKTPTPAKRTAIAG